MNALRNSSGFPLAAIRRGAFVLNEAGRGFTLSIYFKKPRGVRVYIAGRAYSI